MNCQSFQNIVNDLARDQTMEPSVRKQALAHGVECEACAQRLQDQRVLSLSLRGLAAEMRFMDAPRRVEEQLRVAFRAHNFARPHTRGVFHWRYWAAAAAVVFVMFGIAAMRARLSLSDAERPPGETTKVEPLPKQPTAVVEQENSAVLPQKPAAPSRSKLNTNSRQVGLRAEDSRGKDGNAAKGADDGVDPKGSGNETVAANYTETEIATDFLPVGYISPMILQDGGQVVRVELPRSALASFGLPVNMNRANERVKADVLVGTDGLARAIRFVQ